MEESKKVKVVALSFIILVAAALIIYFVFVRDSGSSPVDVPEAAVPEVTDELSEEPSSVESDPVETILVALDESDSLVRDLVGPLSSHPELARWLVTQDVIRKFVAAVDNIANGHSPRQQIDFFNPQGEFSVREGASGFSVDAAAYTRYNVVADVFSSLDSKGTAQLYRQLSPSIQEAYKDLGYPEGKFHSTFMRAIDELLRVPVVAGDVMLEEKLKSFAMADVELEAMSQAQKHLFRMGPQNVRAIQSKLRELKALL
ncbi:MAG: DUF3014 domain-containing protein [Candidatus Aminicenantes bacterium]|nr:DUF3014 domain-containing protein [Candidatus Aminicenantes bacterium]